MWNAYPKVILFNAFCIQFSCPQINLFSVWTCLDMSGHVWTCLDMSGHVWTCLDMSGHVWTCLDIVTNTMYTWMNTYIDRIIFNTY
jgi:hypothetical protein